MSAFWKKRSGRAIAVTIGALSIIVVAVVIAGKRSSCVAEEVAAPPTNQKYIGTKKCAACHFPQFRTWRKTKHAKSFEILPAKYHKNSECLKCHSTGHGEPTGYKDASTSQLAGTACEACHGPGSEHAKIALKFVEEDITEEAEKAVRDSIFKIQPKNACVGCHQTKGHKAHPDYDKE